MNEFPTYNRLRRCKHGQMLFNVNDRYIGRSLDLYGEYSEGEIDLFGRVVGYGNVIVEVGANIGTHTVFFAQQVGVAGRVLAFEPQRIVFQTLCANVAINNFTNVECQQQALGESVGTIKTPWLDPTKEFNFGGLELGKCEQGEKVPLISLDSLELSRLDLLKVDVEGMEFSVISGATATVSRCRPILYIENDRSDRSDRLIRLLDRLNYNLYWHCPPLFSENNFFGNETNVFGSTVSKNMFGVHRCANKTIIGLQPVERPH